MSETLVRLKGVPSVILNQLTEQGYYGTRTEAIRAGILELGKEYGLIGSPAYHREQLYRLVSRRKVPLARVEKELERLEE